MKARRLLVATALVGTLGVMSCKQRRYANTKHPTYPDAPAADAGADATPMGDAPPNGDVTPPAETKPE